MTWYDFFTDLIQNWISCGSTIVGNDDTVIDKSQRTLQIESLESESFFLGCEVCIKVTVIK
jgi:hypothetical protein